MRKNSNYTLIASYDYFVARVYLAIKHFYKDGELQIFYTFYTLVVLHMIFTISPIVILADKFFEKIPESAFLPFFAVATLAIYYLHKRRYSARGINKILKQSVRLSAKAKFKLFLFFVLFTVMWVAALRY